MPTSSDNPNLMTVLIRVDASIQIGTGHVVRCLALAAALQNKRCRVIFLCRDFTGNLVALIRERGFEAIVLPVVSESDTARPGYESWLGESWQTDARQTIGAIGTIGVVSWLVVDHYGIDARWHKELHAHVKKILIIDDLINKECDSDLYLNYSVLDDHFAPLGYAKRALLGLQYAIVRDDFYKQRPSLPPQRHAIKNAMIFLGGTDPNNVFPVVFDAVKAFPELHFHFVLGVGLQNRTSILEKIAAHNFMTCHENITDMPAFMKKMDLYIGSGGTITWERMVMGLTGLVIAVADNQIPASAALHDRHAHEYLGSYRQVSSELIKVRLRALLGDPQHIAAMSLESFNLVDGLGLSRVVTAMQIESITVRKADLGDCVAVFEWRNDPHIRRQAMSDDVLDFRVHKEWFENTLKNPLKQIYIAEIGATPLGVVRFENNADDGVLISIYLVPQGIGSGWGKALLAAGMQQYRCDHKNVRLFYAQIKDDNVRSQKIFIANGFHKQQHRYIKEVA